VVVDSHVHIFPHLGGANGFPTVRDHLLFLQLYAATHSNPVRRLRDHRLTDDCRPLAGPPTSPDALLDADFRVGRFGRLEWTLGGEDYYLQFFPPSLQQMESPPEFMLQQMAHAGIDCAVLQNAHLYGRLDDYFAAAARRYPGRFIGLASIDEARADTPAELRRLRRSIEELGLRGLYYANRGLFTEGYRRGFDDGSFDGFWEEVRRLRIPVFWELQGIPEPARENLLAEVERLNRWAEKFPDIPCVYTHGFPPDLVLDPPEPLLRLFRRDQFLFEILYPIHWGRDHRFPYPELRPVLRSLYHLVGAERLVWGSDMPNVERNCTYRQALDYLFINMDFARPSELELIVGGNILRLFAVRSTGSEPG
jgi:predicted TIM-barrel fold metal-dependent hydrolase